MTSRHCAFVPSPILPQWRVQTPLPSTRTMPQMSSPALRDVRVLCTTPPVYATALSAILLQVQARPVHAPTVETERLEDDERAALEDAILRLSDYNLVVFLSRSAISVFAEVLNGLVEGDQEAGLLSLRASAVSICAMGADAHAVREMLGVTTDIIPVKATPSGIVDALAADECWTGKKVLIPVPLVKGMEEPPVVPDFLREMTERVHCEIASVPAYVTTPVARERLAVELDWLDRTEVNAVVVSSCGEAYALRALLQDEEYVRFVNNVREGRLVLAAHGPVTAVGLRKMFPVDIVVSNDSSSFTGVVGALVENFALRLRDSGILILPK